MGAGRVGVWRWALVTVAVLLLSAAAAEEEVS